MFLLINQGRVIIGPKDWNRHYFQEVLRDELDIDHQLPSSIQPYQVIDIDDHTKIIWVNQLDTVHWDGRFQRLDGPFFNFHETHADVYYTPVDLPLDVAKSFCKSQIADLRYARETSGFKMLVGNIEVTIDTARGSRDIFLQTYSMMDDTDTINWKFPEAWLTLTRAELGSIVLAGKTHIKLSFDWELQKDNEIDACSDMASLRAVMQPIDTDRPTDQTSYNTIG